MFFRQSLYEKALRRMTMWDMALVKLSALTLGIALALLIPQIRELNPWWYIGATVVLAVKPLMILYRK